MLLLIPLVTLEPLSSIVSHSITPVFFCLGGLPMKLGQLHAGLGYVRPPTAESSARQAWKPHASPDHGLGLASISAVFRVKVFSCLACVTPVLAYGPSSSSHCRHIWGLRSVLAG